MRSITIGCTINLERYENLRVDVTDDDADRALALMCETLDRLGRSDPATSTAIDSYRQRVFGVSQTTGAHTGTQQESTGDAEGCEPEQITEPPISEHTPPEKPAQTDGVETCDLVCGVCGLKTDALSAGGMCKACLEFAELDTGKKKPAKKPNTDPAPAKEKPPKPEPKPEAGANISNYICEDCQVEITKIQHDVSQMFMGRDLCKPCMNQQPKERAA